MVPAWTETLDLAVLWGCPPWVIVGDGDNKIACWRWRARAKLWKECVDKRLVNLSVINGTG